MHTRMELITRTALDKVFCLIRHLTLQMTRALMAMKGKRINFNSNTFLDMKIEEHAVGTDSVGAFDD